VALAARRTSEEVTVRSRSISGHVEASGAVLLMGTNRLVDVSHCDTRAQHLNIENTRLFLLSRVDADVEAACTHQHRPIYTWLLRLKHNDHTSAKPHKLVTA
jgi:hypothetical protein